MTKTFAMAISLALIVTISVSPVWAVGDKVRSDNAAGPAGEDVGGDPQVSRGTPVGESIQNLSVQEDMNGKNGQTGTTQILTAEEENALLFMREEEKLARDVYSALADKWLELAIFNNIAASEERHMNAVLNLLGKYGVAYTKLDIGKFTYPALQDLYNQLLETGKESLIGALNAGITIEEEDIADLKEFLGLSEDNYDDKLTEKTDINQVFENLLDGSYRHLEAFERNLNNY